MWYTGNKLSTQMIRFYSIFPAYNITRSSLKIPFFSFFDYDPPRAEIVPQTFVLVVNIHYNFQKIETKYFRRVTTRFFLSHVLHVSHYIRMQNLSVKNFSAEATSKTSTWLWVSLFPDDVIWDYRCGRMNCSPLPKY